MLLTTNCGNDSGISSANDVQSKIDYIQNLLVNLFVNLVYGVVPSAEE